MSLLFITTVSYKKKHFLIGFIGDKQQTRFSDDLFAQIYPHVRVPMVQQTIVATSSVHWRRYQRIKG